MILTEEQRGALARAIDYINETDLPVGELDGFDREVLRAMIDSSDPITDVTELVELLAAGEHEQWAAWAQAILDSEPGLSDGRKAAWPGLIATPYENLSEELKDKDRREVYLRSGDALAEIERLRAIIDTPPEEAEWKSDLEVLDIATQSSTIDIEIAKKWHSAYRRSQNSNLLRKQENERLRAEMENYGDDYVCQMKSKDARIKELKKEIRRLKKESKTEQGFTNSYILHLHEAEARIKELEEALVEERTGAIRCESYDHCEGMYRIDLPDAMIRAQQELQAEGKIGPDAKPRSWQITDERKATLSASLKVLERLKKNNTDTDHSYLDRGITVLRAMLTEAGL